MWLNHDWGHFFKDNEVSGTLCICTSTRSKNQAVGSRDAGRWLYQKTLFNLYLSERSLKIFTPSRLALQYLALQKQRCILQRELLVKNSLEDFQDRFLWNLFSELISCLTCHWESPYWWNTACAASIQEDIAGSTQINLKTFLFLHKWDKFYGLSFQCF